MGRSRGGLTSKIHAVVDTNGLPVRLGLTAGEAHDNRLLENFCLASDRDQCCWLIVDMTRIRAFATERGAWGNSAQMQSRG
jgi:transposase